MHKSTDENFALATQTVEGQQFLGKSFEALDRYKLQGQLVDALEKTEFHQHLANKVLNCHKKFRHKRCENNHSWASADNSCSVRLCPHCSERKVKTQASRIQNFVVGKENLKYLVLAERNSKSLAEGIASLYAAWNSLRRSVFWKQKVSGSIAVLEVTYSKKRNDWHPHLNILFEGDYIPFKQLNLIWRKITGDRGRTTHINKANEGTVYELIKYTLKIAEYQKTEYGRVLALLFDDPGVLDEFLSAVYGARLIRTYGSFRSMPVEQTDESHAESCPDCSSTTWVDLGPVSHDQLSFDFDKEVFRVNHTVEKVARAWLRTVEFDGVALARETDNQRRMLYMGAEMRQLTRKYEQRVSAQFAERIAA